jgi:hypothetical protein
VYPSGPSFTMIGAGTSMDGAAPDPMAVEIAA